jgi:hypothetical protein
MRTRQTCVVCSENLDTHDKILVLYVLKITSKVITALCCEYRLLSDLWDCSILHVSQWRGYSGMSDHDCEMGKFVSFTRNTQTYKATGSTGTRIKTIQKGVCDSALLARTWRR